jgi:O-antigen/teichoic acid export membrane protein
VWTRLRSRIVPDLPPAFLTNVSWQYLASLASVALGFAYALVVARGLGLVAFGLIGAAQSFAALVFLFVELRLHEAVIRYIAEFWERGDGPRTMAATKLFLLADVVTGLMALLLVVGLASWAHGHLIRDARAVPVVLLAGLAAFFGNVATATALGLFRIFGQFRTQALISISGGALRVVATVAAVWLLRWDVVAIMAVLAGSSLVTNATLVGVAWREIRKRIPSGTIAPLRLLGPRLVEIARFVASNYAASLAGVPTKELDVNLLSLFTSLQVVGLYKIAKSFLAGLLAASDAAFFVVYPELARLWARGRFVEIGAFVRRVVVLFGAGGFVLYGAAFFAVPVLVRALFGAAFVEAGVLFRWMGWGVLFWAPFVWVNPLLLAAGRADLSLWASLLGSAIVVALYLICIPPWGGVGAAAVLAASIPVMLTCSGWLGWRSRIIPQVLRAAESATARAL